MAQKGQQAPGVPVGAYFSVLPLDSGGYNALHLLCHGKRFREEEIVDAGFYLVMEAEDR